MTSKGLLSGIFVQSSLLLILLLSTTTHVSAAIWQDDPFAPDTQDRSSTDDSGNQIGKPVMNESLDEGLQLILRSIDQANPREPISLARAIKSTLDIEQYDWANYYLGLLINSGATAEQIFEMHNRMGPDFFLQVHGQAELQPRGRQYGKLVFETVERIAKSPDRIARLIQKLSDPDITIRSEAFRKLKRLGAPAAAAMLNVFLDNTRKNEFPILQTAVENLGETSLMPIIGAARADGTIMQAVALSALGNIKNPLAVDSLYRAFLSRKVPEPTRNVALTALQKQISHIPAIGPTIETAQHHLSQRAKKYLRGDYSLMPGPGGIVDVWRWSATDKKLVSEPTIESTALRVLASDVAGDLYELNPASSENRQLYLLSLLDKFKRMAGPDRTVKWGAVTTAIPDANWIDVNQALGTAINLELYPAAIAAAEVAEQSGDLSFLLSANNRPSNLVRALIKGQRHLQFAAAKAIAGIDPHQPFAGSSYMVKSAINMASTNGVSAGLVGHNRAEIAQSFAAVLGQNGMVGKSATSSRDLFAIAVENPDIDIILITDTLSNPHYQELVQQLKNDWRTKRIPIGLLIRDTERKIRAEQTIEDSSNFIVLPLTLDSRQIYEQVLRLRSLQDPWPVSDLQRILHAEFAVGWLTRIISAQRKYRFYDVISHHDKLVRMIDSPGPIETKSELLANVGTPAAQRVLVNFASENGLPIVQRKLLADAFAKSVQKNGTLLTKNEIKRQYDRYNASESQSKDVQNVLASILDSIESRARD